MDKTQRLWEVATGKCVRTFEAHEDLESSVYMMSAGSVSSVCMNADGRYALSAGWHATLKLWDVATGHCLRTFGEADGVSSVCFSPDGRCALSGGDETLKLWDVATGHCLQTFGETDGVSSVCFSPDGRYALSGGDAALKLWEVTSGQCLRAFEGHTGLVNSVCLSADGRYALSGSDDKTMKLWEVATGRCLRTFEWHVDMVRSVCMSADGSYAVSGGQDALGGVWFLDWDLEDNRPADWDEGARPYLEVFLTTHQPYAGELPATRTPTDEEVVLALTRKGRPVWTEDDFNQFLYTLGCVGYGWLRAEGVRRELEQMTAGWK
jgi:WD40 repeat protein